jgi:photosystem II stability/assembly factor-like uncharacterized protein
MPTGSPMKTTFPKSLAAISLCAFLGACATAPDLPTREVTKTYTLPTDTKWQKLDTVAYRGKQDDIFFLNADLGWYVNGGGKIYKTIDGGKTWIEKLSQPGTFFRTVGFVNEKIGFAGNIGTDYFPGVTDTTPLYMTDDGGDTWRAVSAIDGPMVKGLCAIDVLHTKFINSGVLDSRTVIHAGGRVGGPAFLLRSLDGGKTWKSQNLSAHTKMILDVKFFDENRGFIMGASDTDTEKSNALIIATQDGGATWKKVYQSTRPFEITWKASFPTRDTGYVTIQNYNPDKTISQRYVAKTTDGGATWNEIPLVNDHAVRQFGVGFADEKIGWVGTTTGGYQTTDGGATWASVADMGRASNKVRIIRDGNGFVAYAIGLDVRKITVPGSEKK